MSAADKLEAVIGAHLAHLMDLSTPFVSRLNRADREDLLEKAFEAAQRSAEQLNSPEFQIGKWWVSCLRKAALTRKSWAIHYTTSTCDVSGEKLGRVSKQGIY